MSMQRQGGIKMIDVTSAAVFAVLAVVGFAGGDAWIINWGRATAAFVLAAVMLISAATVPFSEQYARESVPQQYWTSPVFRAKNRKISALWGVVMLVMTGSHLIATVLLDDGVTAGQFLLNWAVPALLVYAAIKQSKKIAAVNALPQTAGATR